MKKNNKKGFTLAELLVVVGIIAVLVAIAIPVFSGAQEKANEAVDAANIRAAYAEVITAGLTGDTAGQSKDVKLKQTETKWQNSFDFPENLKAGTTEPAKDGTATVAYSATDGGATVTIKLTPTAG